MNTYVSKQREGALGKKLFLPDPRQLSLWLWRRIGMTLRFTHVLAQGEISEIGIGMCMKRTACVVVGSTSTPLLQVRPSPSPFPAARSHEFHQSSHPPTDSIFACSAPVGATATICRDELVGPACVGLGGSPCTQQHCDRRQDEPR